MRIVGVGEEGEEESSLRLWLSERMGVDITIDKCDRGGDRFAFTSAVLGCWKMCKTCDLQTYFAKVFEY